MNDVILGRKIAAHPQVGGLSSFIYASHYFCNFASGGKVWQNAIFILLCCTTNNTTTTAAAIKTAIAPRTRAYIGMLHSFFTRHFQYKINDAKKENKNCARVWKAMLEPVGLKTEPNDTWHIMGKVVIWQQWCCHHWRQWSSKRASIISIKQDKSMCVQNIGKLIALQSKNFVTNFTLLSLYISVWLCVVFRTYSIIFFVLTSTSTLSPSSISFALLQ